jgi:CheY-like chemotaxis protein
MAYNVMRQHSGGIDIQSSVGEGTCVTCWLPLASSPTESARPAAAIVDQARLRVLLVDDEEVVRKTTRRALEHLGHEVIDADGGAAAIARYFDPASRVDVVLLDLSMPGMNGVQCLERLRARDPSVRVALYTGNAQDLSRKEAGGALVLRKPITLTSLSQALRRLSSR